MWGWGFAVVFGLLTPLAVCGAGTSERYKAPTTVECVAHRGDLVASTTLADGAGNYKLTLTSGDHEDMRSVTGTLHLEKNERALMRLISADQDASDTVLVPLYGWAVIDLTAVDAVEMGDIGSRDALRPGVLVLEQRPSGHAQVAITLRFGSVANRRGAASVFNGGYMALHVSQVDASGSFTGRWVSGERNRQVTGEFCATRLQA